MGRKLMRVGERSSMWLVGMQLGIRRAKTEVKAREGRKGLALMGGQTVQDWCPD
jgi:hypothetical protein